MIKKSFVITKFLLKRSILIGLFIVILSTVAMYARGYRLNLSQQKVTPNGILVVSSYPTGSKVLIDGVLRGATNTNITLNPGKYTVEITKEGYSSWQKEIIIKGELVIKVDALLYPTNPSLSPITNLGVNKAWFFPSEEKTLLLSLKNQELAPIERTATDTAQTEQKRGVYLLDTSKTPFRISNPLRLLALQESFTSELVEDELEAVISPDADQVLLIQKNKQNLILTAYLLSLSASEQQPFIVTNSAEQILEKWDDQRMDDLNKKIEALKKPLDKIALNYFDIIDFSPEKDKVLYRAKKSTSLPEIIKPPLIATNQTEETREIEINKIYIYDIKEDKNYIIPYPDDAEQADDKTLYNNQILWFADSQHIVMNERNKITVVYYDGAHKNTVYSGPYLQDFIGVTTDFKLLILANLNPDKNAFPDLYSVGIR